MNIHVIYEDNDILVLSKPAGLLVHGIYDKFGPKHSEKVLTDWLLEKYPKIKKVGDKPEQRPGIVHRLDRETSGVMVVAKTQKAFTYLKKQFQDRNLKKIYEVLAWGTVKENQGSINKPISIIDGSVKRTIFKGKAPREAVTEYTVLKRLKRDKETFTLLEVSPKTGRTHQIRVHLSSIGHQVYGDKLYGKKGDIFNLGRQFLHAKKLRFKLPSGKEKTFEAELPELLQNFLKDFEPRELDEK